MNKIIPYIYLVVGIVWLIDGITKFIQTEEVYHIFLSFNTENKYYYLSFKAIVGILVILAGLRRLKANKQ